MATETKLTANIIAEVFIFFCPTCFKSDHPLAGDLNHVTHMYPSFNAHL